jgi:hypothetical protein
MPATISLDYKACLTEAVTAIGRLQTVKELESIIMLAQQAIEVQRGRRGGGEEAGKGQEVWSALCDICKERNAPSLQQNFGALVRRAGAVGSRLKGALALAEEEIESAVPKGLTKQQRTAYVRLLLQCAWMEAEKKQWWQPTLTGLEYLLRNLAPCLCQQFPGYYKTQMWNATMLSRVVGK